jgi:hypothetical protein
MSAYDRDRLKQQCELLLKIDHDGHEDIVSELQKCADPYAIPFLRQAIDNKPLLAYLDYDDYGAFYKRCLWALRAIDTPESIAVIEAFAQSEIPELREQAEYRLSRIRNPGA